MSYLYRYETKGIQNWILASNKLRDLAGGSILVEELTQIAREAVEALGGVEVLQATSGAMTAVFPDREKLQKFASEWPMQVALRTPGLQLVQGWVTKDEGMQALFEVLSSQRNLATVTGVEANPWVVRAGQSGLPAVVAKGRSKSRSTSQDLVALAREWAFESGKKRGADLVVTGGHDWDFFEIDFEKWPAGPVAVVHADGSGIGQALMRLNDDAKLKAFSQALKEATFEAVVAALREVSSKTGSNVFARPVVSAGDDLTYIVPAQDARRFCQAWLRTFERETEARKAALGGERLVGGAGVVMVNSGYPFSTAYELAEELCKAAKDKLKASKRKISILAFKRVTNSLVEGLSKDAVGWTIEGADGEPLERLVAAVREMPRGTLRTWLDHFQRPDGEAQAKRLWARAGEVAENRLWESFKAALTACGADPQTGELKDEPGQTALKLGGAKTTPIADALALRFVEKEPANVG